jgi:hypothetical protein
MGSHDFTTASLDGLLQKLPQLTRVMMAGAIEGTDAYEPLGRCTATTQLHFAMNPFLNMWFVDAW